MEAAAEHHGEAAQGAGELGAASAGSYSVLARGGLLWDPRYGEVAPECASMEDKHGHAFPSEAQEVTDPWGDVPNSALNEELVKSTSTASRDEAGNSKTSGSNVEDAAPTSEKGDSEEGQLALREDLPDQSYSSSMCNQH